MKIVLSMLFTLLCFSVPAIAAGPSGELPAFPGVLSIPIPKDIDFGGYFKAHQPVKIVFGVSDPGAQLKESLANAGYVVRYLSSKGYRYQIQIVLYGTAVLAADEWNQLYSGYGNLMQALYKQGVQFRVCYNSMHALHVQRSDVYPYMKVTPAGILQLVKKQLQGYAYISNQPK